jgi:hypothetical protein
MSKENLVRVIDVFVDKLDIARLRFQTKSLKPEGRPPFMAPSAFNSIIISASFVGIWFRNGSYPDVVVKLYVK